MERTTDWFEITRIQLRNIRGFRKLDLDLRDAEERPRKRTLIIGKNGTCKTSLLRSIAIGLTDRADANYLSSEPVGGLVCEGCEEGAIKVTASGFKKEFGELEFGKTILREGDRENVFTIFQQDKADYQGKPLPPFVCGYGAGRYGVGPDSARSYRISDSVKTLFRYEETLISPELTLRRLHDFFRTRTDIYERTLQGIKRALGLTEADKIDLPLGGGIEISGPTVGERIRLEGWADGYRMTFSWILDLYAWALKAGSIDEEGYVEGILLVDEIDQHLHPSMQSEILPRLSELLPKMQIFATTHSPLVALDARPEELVVLRREGDHVVAEQRVPDFSGYSAEDMLSDSRLFDTEVYGSETQEKLNEYRKLASIPKEERSPEERHKLRSLAAEINSFETPQERESETSRILKELMAKYGLGPPTGQQHPPGHESGGVVVIKKAGSDLPPPKVSPQGRRKKRVGTSTSVGGGPTVSDKGTIFFNGIDGRTGHYLLPPMTARQVAALGMSARAEEREWLARIRNWAEGDGSRSPILDVDPRNLAETGWGVVYAPGTSAKVKTALSPLLSHRHRQAGDRKASYFKEFEHQKGETASQFLQRNGAKMGAVADPDYVPYYLLLVGDPEAIPFTFQTQLDVNYAVGRLYFDIAEDYERYAQSVVDAETGKLRPRLPRQVSLFGVRNQGDAATQRTADELVRPLADTLVETEKGWELRAYLAEKADKAQLTRLLGGPDVPSLLFAACHGVSFPTDDECQLARQGALVCQDWAGPDDELGVTQDDYFAADDLSADAHLHGLIAFLLASYSAGTPALDSFEQRELGKPQEIAPHAFVSRLLQRLLSHPNGCALAVVGHIDRAWTTSFEGSSHGEGVDVYRNALRRLLKGHTVGWAMEYFNQAHAMMSAELADLWESRQFQEGVDLEWFSSLWMAHNDARNFVVFGDPAVKLAAT